MIQSRCCLWNLKKNICDIFSTYICTCNITFGVSIWTSDSASFWPSWVIRIDLILIHLGRMFVVNFLSYKCRDLRIAFCIIEMIACTTLYHSQGGADEIYWFYSIWLKHCIRIYNQGNACWKTQEIIPKMN